MNKTYLYCNATVRPKFCMLETNLCCCVCKHNEECTVSNQVFYPNCNPCKPEDLEDDDRCSFLL